METDLGTLVLIAAEVLAVAACVVGRFLIGPHK